MFLLFISWVLPAHCAEDVAILCNVKTTKHLSVPAKMTSGSIFSTINDTGVITEFKMVPHPGPEGEPKILITPVGQESSKPLVMDIHQSDKKAYLYPMHGKSNQQMVLELGPQKKVRVKNGNKCLEPDPTDAFLHLVPCKSVEEAPQQYWNYLLEGDSHDLPPPVVPVPVAVPPPETPTSSLIDLLNQPRHHNPIKALAAKHLPTNPLRPKRH